MKIFYKALSVLSLLTLALFVSSAIAFPGPGPGPGPGPNPAAMIAIDQIKDKVCFMRLANNIKSCMNACPMSDMKSGNPDLKGAMCIAACIEDFSTSAEKCM